MDIILTESKSLQNGEIGLPGTTGTNPQQMSGPWIVRKLEEMEDKGSSDVVNTAAAIQDFLDKKGTISKFITAPNKETGIFNIVNFGSYTQ